MFFPLLSIAMLLPAAPAEALSEQPAGGPFATAIEAARQRVVKLYGGGFGQERGYGSGVIVSGDGQIVTTLSVLLESPAVRVVLPDGRRFPARVVKRDEARQLAVLDIEADGLPCFELTTSEHLCVGDWVIAAANAFKVADGPEPVSVTVGVCAGRATLSARRRKQDFAYEGPVLLTDIIITTPGSAGGALVDADGRLVGVIGKAVISNRTNTWANYALPVEEVAAVLREPAAEAGAPAVGPETSQTAARPDLGIRLFDVGGRARPAYVERVRPGSPAQRAGIRPNDLILSLADEAIGTCTDFYKAHDTFRVGEEITIVVKRGDELKTIQLTVTERSQ